MSHHLQEVFDRRDMDVRIAEENARARLAVLKTRQMMDMDTWMSEVRISNIKRAEFDLATARFQCDVAIVQGFSQDAFFAACAELATAKSTLNELSWLAELSEYQESNEIRKAARDCACGRIRFKPV